MTRPAEGSVITTQFQSAGRGQRGTSWSSEKGLNLLMSMILYPSWMKIQDQFQLSQCVAVGLVDAVRSVVSADTKIKWPNDLMVERKKLSGILIELHSDSQTLSSATIGIGLNVNQTEFGTLNATSLKQIADHTFDPLQIAKVCQQSILRRYDELKSGQIEVIARDYHHLLYQLNTNERYMLRGEEIHARIVGVDVRGCIQLLDHRGMHTADIKELVYL